MENRIETLARAHEILANARKHGTSSMPATEFAEYESARAMVHADRLANDAAYARGYHAVYSKLSRAYNWRDTSFNTTTASE